MPSNDKKNAFKILYQEHEGYLHAIISGDEDSLATSLEYWQRVIAECHKRNLKTLLVEENFPNQLSIIEIFHITSAIPGMGSMGLKIAFVDQQAEQNELNLFGENVATNRGVHGRVFQTRLDAIAWLRL